MGLTCLRVLALITVVYLLQCDVEARAKEVDVNQKNYSKDGRKNTRNVQQARYDSATNAREVQLKMLQNMVRGKREGNSKFPEMFVGEVASSTVGSSTEDASMMWNTGEVLEDFSGSSSAQSESPVTMRNADACYEGTEAVVTIKKETPAANKKDLSLLLYDNDKINMNRMLRDRNVDYGLLYNDETDNKVNRLVKRDNTPDNVSANDDEEFCIEEGDEEAAKNKNKMAVPRNQRRSNYEEEEPIESGAGKRGWAMPRGGKKVPGYDEMMKPVERTRRMSKRILPGDVDAQPGYDGAKGKRNRVRAGRQSRLPSMEGKYLSYGDEESKMKAGKKIAVYPRAENKYPKYEDGERVQGGRKVVEQKPMESKGKAMNNKPYGYSNMEEPNKTIMKRIPKKVKNNKNFNYKPFREVKEEQMMKSMVQVKETNSNEKDNNVREKTIYIRLNPERRGTGFRPETNAMQEILKTI
uniref:Uncharacterized protein n=1 Tax=Clastoptera arizonana TaxID=38151 RepID=A0A1B6E8A0_9HEMI